MSADCPDCGLDADGIDCGRDDTLPCFQDPTPQQQWEVTTPKGMP